MRSNLIICFKNKARFTLSYTLKKLADKNTKTVVNNSVQFCICFNYFFKFIS